MTILIERFNYLDSAALFSTVANQDWAIFLDSGITNGQSPATKHADYDVLAIKPITTLVYQQRQTLISNEFGSKAKEGDPLTVLQQTLADVGLDKTALNSGQDLPAYLPGAYGYFSYDLARLYEDLPNIALNDEQLPEMAMGIYSCIVVINHQTKNTFLVSVKDHSNSELVAQHWRQLIASQLAIQSCAGNTPEQYLSKLKSREMTENMSQLEYHERFATVQEYIVEGDCYQVNLAKQFSTSVTGDSWQTYAFLRELSPAPYGAYLNLPFAQILSNSPESFIQCREGSVVTSPIKGTRARDHQNKQRDKQIADELFNSDKDRAENLMIVDLMRNDLSTCCELGSVEVPSLFALHSFANVHHLISTVKGELRSGLHCLDLLRKCFPGGSITGAPKIRAMQIIEELEPHRRGLYCGAIGYIGLDGNMETNIAIRTIVVKDGIARYSAGGGLVVDSNVDGEYQEVVDKAKMMTAALFN